MGWPARHRDLEPFGRRPGIGDGIPAEALVLQGDGGISTTRAWTGSMELLVRVGGRPASHVDHRCWLTREKHPVAGFVLPVTVDRGDATRIEVRWDEVPTIEERVAGTDPAILDPEGTWRLVQEARRQITDSVLAAEHPETAALRQRMREDPEQEGAWTSSPWEQVTLPGWPPPEGLADGRLAGTALVVSAPSPTRDGRTYRHFAAKGYAEGTIYDYQGWLLLCIELPDRPRYGVYRRVKILTPRMGMKLPVAVDRERPHEPEILWDRAPDQFGLAAQRVSAATGQVRDALQRFGGEMERSATAALANIGDPSQRAAAERVLEQYGIPFAANTPPPAPAGSEDIAGELRRLSALRDGGVLSEEEYRAERARVLERL